MLLKLIVLSVLWGSISRGEEAPGSGGGGFAEKAGEAAAQALEAGKDAVGRISEQLSGSRELRAQSKWTVLASYSFLDLWIPSKIGASVAYSPDENGSWELEYLRGSLSFELIVKDLGKMTDERLSLVYRSYGDRNSFSLFGGLGYHSFSIHLGDRMLSLLSSRVLPSVDLVTVKTLGVTGGIGNRWQLSRRWALGVDWLTLYIPLRTLEAEAPYLQAAGTGSARDDVADVMDFLKRIPVVAVIKAQLGFCF